MHKYTTLPALHSQIEIKLETKTHQLRRAQFTAHRAFSSVSVHIILVTRVQMFRCFDTEREILRLLFTFWTEFFCKNFRVTAMVVSKSVAIIRYRCVVLKIEPMPHCNWIVSSFLNFYLNSKNHTHSLEANIVFRSFLLLFFWTRSSSIACNRCTQVRLFYFSFSIHT